jgi:hypothetical protein
VYPKLIYVFAVLLLVSPLGAQVDCASAAAVGEGAHAYDTSAGTTSGAAACDSDMENDTWFAYTASCSGDATVSTCGQTGTDSDSVLIVYDSCANANENCITSADDGCGDSGFMSEVTFAVTGGTTYMVQLGGSQGPGGTGTLEISLLTPGNCAGAVAVGEGAHEYDTSACTTSGAAACETFMSKDTWFAYTASGTGTASISTCGQTGTDFNSVLIVYDNCASANGFCIASSDDGCGVTGFMSEVTFAVATGTTYMVQLGGSQGPGGTGGTGGTGTLEISLSTFRRGDANDSGEFDGVADALALLGYLFSSSEHTCIDALDSNDDGQIDITDAYYLLHYQFSSGEAPPAPGIGSCGVDPTDDALDCESYESCG